MKYLSRVGVLLGAAVTGPMLIQAEAGVTEGLGLGVTDAPGEILRVVATLGVVEGLAPGL